MILWHILGTFIKKWLLLTVLPFFLPLLFPFDVEQGASVDQDQPLQGVGGLLSWKEFGSLTMRCTIPAPGLFFSVIYTNPNWYVFQFHQMLGGAYSGEVGRDNVRARKEFKIPHTALASVAQCFSSGLWTENSLVQLLVRAHTWVMGQVPSWGCGRGNHTLRFPSLSPSFPLSLKK